MVTPMPAIQVGQRAKLSKTITEADVVLYAGVVGDFSPLHVNEEYASKTRMGTRTASPMLAGGLVSAVLGNQLPGPAFVFLRQQFEFLAPIFIGDTVTASVEVVSVETEKRIVCLRTDCYNQANKQLLTGEAVLMVLEKISS
ncbi:MAG: MaoC family dehydratase [Anaerolineaceae bacterium]|jgi:3-hydroxybutyryl-CoA dehydratase|nr:MaoC family dehydratase [Anaerolineaceae bacterium]